MSTLVTFPQLQNVRQAQRILGINRAILQALITSGQLPAYDLGKHSEPGKLVNFRFKPGDVEACRRAIYVSCFDPCSIA